MKKTPASPCLVTLLGLFAVAASASGGLLDAYASRLPVIRAQLPLITKSAEAAAARKLAFTNATVAVTHRDTIGFAAEFMARAGGLSESAGLEVTKNTTNNIGLSGIRSWSTNNPKGLATLAKAHNAGLMIVLFAATNGMPTNCPADFVIDNGGDSSPGEDAALNSLVNVSSAWIWTCEYAAALTRLGQRPGILKSISYPDGQEFNAVTRSNRPSLWPCQTSIPAGELGGQYLARLERMVRDLGAESVQGPIRKAAELAAARINEGRPVLSATCTHFLKEEVGLNLKSPFKAFRPYNDGFSKNLKPGDLLIWMGYIGTDTAHYRHGDEIRKTGADLIASFVPDAAPSNNAPYALVTIPQPWELGDAEVAVPFPPGKMAPVSGLVAALEYRMIDEAVAARLKKDPLPHE